MTNYCGFNKCPDCGAIDLREDDQKTRILCEICIKKGQDIELTVQIQLKLEILKTFLGKAEEELHPRGSLVEAKLYIDDAQKELERIFKLL